jgi:hypothetical protein
MPTNANGYNSRITDETLEKKFRDSFRAQGGAELVDDLYASGVIVPVIDFSDAALGSTLSQNLQTAWDFTTGHRSVVNTTTTLISNAGFWKVDLNHAGFVSVGASSMIARLNITDGLTSKVIWQNQSVNNAANTGGFAVSNEFVVFLRSGDSLTATTTNNLSVLNVWYRQIADISGDLVNPSGFTSS